MGPTQPAVTNSNVLKYQGRHSQSHPHAVQFYEKNESIVEMVSQFIFSGLKNNEGVMVIATSATTNDVRERLGSMKFDVSEAKKNGQLLILDAQDILKKFMIEGLPDPLLFQEIIGGLVSRMKKSYPTIRAYGEMVNILLQQGNVNGTIELEKLWNQLVKTESFSLLCGYNIKNFTNESCRSAFHEVCQLHDGVVTTDDKNRGNGNSDDHRLIAELQQRTMALQFEIAERKSVELALRKSREELKLAKEAAETANYTKSRFLANMSHEIRSPLTAILGFTDLIKDPQISPEERSGYIDVVARNGRQLSILLNDILDLSKVESGKLEVEYIPVSMLTVVDDILSMFQPEAQGKGLKLNLKKVPDHFPELICSDSTRIRQILINLISNAVKFTEQGEVTLSLEVLRQDSSGDVLIGVRVEDTGIGINKLQQEKVFEPFSQADASTTRKYGGTGLGLSLSKKLAQALEGDLILLESKEGQGSVFFVTLNAHLDRLTDADRRVKTSGISVANSLAGVRVLVADDSPDNRFILQKHLSSAGASVEFAEDGFQAVDRASKGDFHVVLMDVMMPLCDGYEATRQLKKMGFKKPIIALTAHAFREERDKSFAEGCFDHLTKPVNRQVLVAAVTKAAGV